MTVMTLDIAAWDAGYAAGLAGEPLDSCPFLATSRESLSWHSGYVEGKAARVRMLDTLS
jgi:ribosome modulation factor